VVFGSILPWSTAHHERNWFVYKLRGDRMRIEGDLLRSQQFYEAALHEAESLNSKEKKEDSKNDLSEISRLRQKRLQAAAQPVQRSINADEDEDSLDVRTNPREIAFEWENFQVVRSRLTHHHTKKSKNAIFAILLAKENSNAGSDPVRLNELGDCNMMIGHFNEAETIFRRAQSASEGQNEPDSLLLATLDRLALSQWAQEKFAAALETSSKALDLSQKYAPEKYSAILELHRVQIYLENNRFEDGEKLCLGVIKNSHDISKENSWYPLLLLGQCQLAQRKSDPAIQSLNAALMILEKYAPAYDMRVHRVCLALGEAYVFSKQEEPAKKMYARAIDVYCRNGSTSRTNLDTLIARQGHVYCASNKYDIAAFCYKWAANLREAEFGKTHYKVAVMLRNYAVALDQMGEHAKATELRAKAQTMKDGIEEKE
jgi:tetratricopeptide (TPR) repeat protein